MKAIPAKETRKLLFTPIIENNPIALQILGICSALAVTVKMDDLNNVHSLNICYYAL